MHHKLKWNTNNTGYIENQRFEGGLTITDALLKPIVEGYEYDTLNYDEETETYTIVINGVESTMTEDQEVAVINACIQWDNTSFDEMVFRFKANVEAMFTMRVTKLTSHALPHEMTSWATQEAEARNWFADNSASSPMIDILLVERDSNETKAELVDKIIANADTYLALYAEHLGKFQKAIRLAEAATNQAELEAIIF